MALTYQDAYDQTNPSATDAQRDVAAKQLMLGAAANDVYWNHRSELEALRAQAEGHGVIVRGTDEDENPTGVGSGSDPTAGSIPGTAIEDQPGIGTGAPATVADATVVPSEPDPWNRGHVTTTQAPESAPDNPMGAIARLRAQVAKLGGSPEA